MHENHESLSYTLHRAVVFKSFFQLVVIVGDTFIAVIVEEQAKRQAIRFLVFYHASTAFFVIRAGCFWTRTFFHARHSFPPVLYMFLQT